MQPPIAVVRFFLRRSYPCCRASPPAPLLSPSPTCPFRQERTQLLLLNSHFGCVAALAAEREAENCQNSGNPGKPRVGSGRWVGGRWRGWKAPDGLGVVIGPGPSSVPATFSRTNPRPSSGAAPAHTSRCAFPALNYSPKTDSLHLQSFTGKAEET